MKKALKRIVSSIWYYKDGKRIEGIPGNISGNLTGISGDLTDISGNLDDCKLTKADREKGIRVKDLVAE